MRFPTKKCECGQLFLTHVAYVNHSKECPKVKEKERNEENEENEEERDEEIKENEGEEEIEGQCETSLPSTSVESQAAKSLDLLQDAMNDAQAKNH